MINTFMEGTKLANDITRNELILQLYYDDVSFIKVKDIVTKAKSHDVLVRAIVLYPMGFTLDF